MKNLLRLLWIGVSPAVILGCTNGSTITSAPTPKRQTIHFAGSTLPSTLSASYEIETGSHTLPNLSNDGSLQQCLVYGALQSPKLEQSFHAWRAAILRVPQVSALADPKVSFGYFIEEIQTRTGQMEQQLSLTQSFPWWGLLEAKGDVAAAAAQSKWHAYEMERLTLFEKIVKQWTSLVDLEQEIKVVEESYELLSEAERIARRSYEVDKTRHDKLVRLQVELGKLEDTIHKLRDLRGPRIASLNATLSRESAASFSLPKSITLEISSITLEAATPLISNNPLVQAQDSTIREQEIALRVAKLDAKPKWTAGVTYTNLGDSIDPTIPDAGNSPLMGMVGFSIPINNSKYDAAKEEALAKQLAAIASKKAMVHDLNAAMAEAIYQRDDSIRRIEFYETALIPRAEDALSTALVAFSAGKTQAIELLDSQRTLLELQRNLQRSYVAALIADAAISRIVGGSIIEETTE
jgi:outer membrane protein, heavy metal efflux system